MSFEEFEVFGSNLATLTFVLAVALALLRSYGSLEQIVAIARTKTVVGLYSPLFASLTAFGALAFAYGYQEGKLAIFLNGGLVLLFNGIIILYAIRFAAIGESWLRWDVEIPLFGAVFGIPILVLFPSIREETLFIAGCLTLLPMALQAHKVWKEKDPGVLSATMLTSIVVSSLIWLFYGLMVTGWGFDLFIGAQLIIVLITLVLVRKFRKK